MRRILFQYGRFTIWTYPAMLYFGCVAGVVAGNIAAHAAHVDALSVYVATLVLIPMGLTGARLLYVLSHWQLYRRNLSLVWDRNQGGAALYGGLALVLPLSLPVLEILGLSFGAFWDVAVFTILVAMIFGRAGCVMNGCCAGRPSRSWMGLRLPNCSGVWEKRIPTQCLEACFTVVLLLFAIIFRRSLPFPGALFLMVVTGYATGRLALESTRESQGVHRFTIHHAISLLLILSSLSLAVTRWPKVPQVPSQSSGGGASKCLTSSPVILML